MTTSPVERAADQFVSALAQWRVERGMTKKQLAARMGFDPSYVSHVEGRRHKPTEDFARRAEAVLAAGGAIWQRFQEYDELRHARGAALHRDPPVPVQWMPPGTGLIVEQEVAELTYIQGAYRCRIRRALYNAGVEPVTRYLVKIAVDRYPHDPAGSNRHHRQHPLSFEEMDLSAVAGEGGAAEPMHWRLKLDRDAAKEVWLLFANDHGQFPLYPGERTTIEYAYTVGEEKWGQWFQRAVRLPTRNLTVRLDFPVEFEPQVWGVETSLAAEVPVRTPLERHNDAERAVFEWSTDAPLLNARYRLEWRFRGESAPGVGDAAALSVVAPPSSALSSQDGARVWSSHDGVHGPAYWEGMTVSAGRGAVAATADGPGQSVGEHGPVRMPAARGPVRNHADGQPLADQNGHELRASQRMRGLGIVQRGADLLRQRARHFQLPREEADAREAVDALRATLDRLETVHDFSKGVGLAAPQIGMPVAAAVVRPPERGAEPVILLNPRVVDESGDADEQYEGCLSFFDYRGLVIRPLRVDVEHARYDGTRVITSFERAMARLVSHEIDHLEGRLYVDRMATDATLVPVEEYGQSGRPWIY
ncbi:peptide deformylase [Couchioplanes caeruleus]|uniref:Peptide deformylase n=1 Tax=Couchioplanes caeruleus TaxID=56438 RepID=A0A3N1GLT8_9ACTN|nr:peptide deformylase [Couchioplanes caeruleus]ROP31252.1 peptide deformylase [Couchioplanes caeruleus]